MPRTRKRTTEKAKWTEESLKEAINAVLNGNSVKSTAKKYSIPRSTLRDRLKTNITDKPTLGRKPLFTAQQEKEIAEHVLLLSKLFFGISIIELRRLAFELAEANGLPHTFNTKTKLAGPDWIYGFLKRNPGISLRKPEATSLNRISAFNKVEVDLFFKNLETVQEKFKFPASRIYNVDETGISTVHKPGKILGPKGQKQVGAATSWERGKNVTVVCAMSAIGNYIPPMFIYPRQRMSQQLQKGGPRDAIYGCSKNGWINEDLFMEWLQHFQKHSRPTADDPVLLILDNHSSHKTYGVYNFCRTNHIHIVSLPPHSSHRLQPLDICFFGPLKNAFNRECEFYIKTYSSQNVKITPYELAEIFNRAYIRVATLEKGVTGFLTAGIHPLDPNKFEEDDFVAARQIDSTVCIQDDEEEQQNSSRSTSDPLSVPESTDQNNADLEMEPVPSTSGGNDKVSQPFCSRHTVSVKEISPIPKPCSSKSGRRRVTRKQHSEIITSTPMKAYFEDINNKKAIKNAIEERKKKKLTGKPSKQAKKTCKRGLTFEPSLSSDEEEIDENNLCDDDEDDDIDPARIGDDINVCVICNEFGKNNELWFRCTVCSRWAHAECSGNETAKNYVCDFCLCS